MKKFLNRLNDGRMRSYDADPGLLKEHFGIEETVLAGGYGYRQVLELVQNGADALLEACERGGVSEDKNRIHVLLRNRRLYVANTVAFPKLGPATPGIEMNRPRVTREQVNLSAELQQRLKA